MELLLKDQNNFMMNSPMISKVFFTSVLLPTHIRVGNVSPRLSLPVSFNCFPCLILFPSSPGQATVVSFLTDSSATA